NPPDGSRTTPGACSFELSSGRDPCSRAPASLRHRRFTPVFTLSTLPAGDRPHAPFLFYPETLGQAREVPRAVEGEFGQSRAWRSGVRSAETSFGGGRNRTGDLASGVGLTAEAKNEQETPSWTRIAGQTRT